MSCHDIGRGMNSVVIVVMNLFYEKKISIDSAKTIIRACRKGVHWCDGNEGEAVQSISRCVCGRCLNLVEKGKYLFSVWDISDQVPDRWEIMDNEKELLASDGICEKCFDQVLNSYCNDETAGQREREYIMQHHSESDYISDGNMKVKVGRFGFY